MAGRGHLPALWALNWDTGFPEEPLCICAVPQWDPLCVSPVQGCAERLFGRDFETPEPWASALLSRSAEEKAEGWAPAAELWLKQAFSPREGKGQVRTEAWPGPESLQKALIPTRGYAPGKKGPLYTQSLTERQAVEGVPRGPPWPPDQPAQIHLVTAAGASLSTSWQKPRCRGRARPGSV